MQCWKRWEPSVPREIWCALECTRSFIAKYDVATYHFHWKKTEVIYISCLDKFNCNSWMTCYDLPILYAFFIIIIILLINFILLLGIFWIFWKFGRLSYLLLNNFLNPSVYHIVNPTLQLHFGAVVEERPLLNSGLLVQGSS